MKHDAIDHAQEMVDKLRDIPDEWLRNFKGLIMVVVTEENTGANVSLDLISDLTDEQKIAVIAMIAHKLNLQYDILRDHMDVTALRFDQINWRDYL